MSTIYKRLTDEVFTEKRRPSKSYLKATWKWINIFNEIRELKLNNTRGYFTTIAKNTEFYIKH